MNELEPHNAGEEKTYPAFTITQLVTSSANRHYRVLIDRSILYFIQVGKQQILSEAMRHQGLIGAAAAAALDAKAKRSEQEQTQRYDTLPPKQLLAQGKDNFQLSVDEIRQCLLNPASLLSALVWGNHVGGLSITLTTGKALNFQFSVIEEMKQAVDLLPAVLERKLRVNARWDARRGKFVAQK